MTMMLLMLEDLWATMARLDIARLVQGILRDMKIVIVTVIGIVLPIRVSVEEEKAHQTCAWGILANDPVSKKELYQGVSWSYWRSGTRRRHWMRMWT